MNNKTSIFILSMPNSPRLPYLEKRLKAIGIKKYKVFNGSYGKTPKERHKIYSFYNKVFAKDYIGREMSFNEIGAATTSIKVYRYIVKKNIKNSIIMTDDIYPSIILKQWIENKIFFKGNQVIGFFCAPSGFLEKENYKTIFSKEKIFIHTARTHIFVSQCMQVTLGFCKKYLKVTKGKVSGQNDFPFNLRKNKIKISQTIPYLAYPADRGISFVSSDRESCNKAIFSKKIKNIITSFLILKKLFFFVRAIYYLSYLGYFIQSKGNLDYYNEYYFEKSKIFIINFFTNKYIDIYKIIQKKDNYPKDLKRFSNYYNFDTYS